MPQTLHVQLLGNFSMVYGTTPVTSVNTARLQSLLAYLILHADTPQLRQHVAFLFWPDSSDAQARNNLRQALHALRLALPDHETFVYADTNTLYWRPDAPFRLDVAEFASALGQAAAHQQEHGVRREALERAVNLYLADLLPSCYDEWIVPVRERIRQQYVQALDQLIQLLEAQRDFAAAVDYARRMVRDNPLDEESYRHLMQLLALTGDRAGALSAYHACANTLQRELGVEPSQATYDIYERLLHDDTPAVQTQRPSLTVAPSLIGRQAEWEQLHETWHRTREGGPGIALITGEAGIGKSRLAEDFLLWVNQQGGTTAKTRCYAAEGQLSLAPVTEWLRGDGLRPYLASLQPMWLAEVARILPELSTEYPDLPHYEPISEYGQRQRFFEALAQAILAVPQPLLLLIDDLQWCDQETLEWLHFLLRFDTAAHLLVVGSVRMEETDPRHPLRTLLLDLRNTVGVSEIALQPLDAAESAKLASLVANHDLTVESAMRLFHETEGNPLFIVETMRAGFSNLRTRDESTRPDQHQALASRPPSLPHRVQAVIAARLEQLSSPAREMAALAAAIGREFRLDVLTRAGNTDEDSAVRALDELWQRRIVREQGTNAYDFTHDKLREVAYAEISVPQRHLLHRRIAQALESLYTGDLDSVSGQIASHFEQAGLAEQAIPYYQQAAEVAQRVYANDDAINLLTRGLALLEGLPAGPKRDTQELVLQLALVPIYRVSQGWTAPELERAADRALALCDTVGTDAQRAEALFGWQSMLVVQAKLEKVQLMAEELEVLYQRTQRTALPLSGMMLAGARLHLGRVVDANAAFARMIAAQEPIQSPGLQDAQGWNYAIHTRAWHSHALWCLGYPARALRCGDDAIRLADELGLPFNQAIASAYLALLHQLCADAETARASAEAALALATEHKVPYYRSWSAILVHHARAWEEPTAPHLTRLREAITELKATGARLRLPYYLWLLARVHERAGQIEEGLTIINEALTESRINSERWWDEELHRLRGELMQARGFDAREVEAALRRAVAIAHGQQARSLELRAATSLARLLRERNQAGEAQRVLGDVYAWFTEGFDTPDLQAARSLLAKLL
jgi:DNA-binding SARP family transcriptional activator